MWLNIVAVFVFLQFAACVQVNPCSNLPDVPTPHSFVAAGCDKLPCPLYKGTDANVNITYNIPYDMESSTIDIWAHALGFWVEFKPPDNQICHNLVNAYCPLEEGERVTYNLTLPIIKAYPPLSLNLRMTFRDAKQTPIMCFEVACKVSNPPKP